MARLEADLGLRLLQRTTRHVALSTAGQAFYERVAGSLAELEMAHESLQEQARQSRVPEEGRDILKD